VGVWVPEKGPVPCKLAKPPVPLSIVYWPLSEFPTPKTPVAVNPMTTLPDWPATVQKHVNCPRKLSWPVARTSSVKDMGPDPLKVPVVTMVPERS